MGQVNLSTMLVNMTSNPGSQLKANNTSVSNTFSDSLSKAKSTTYSANSNKNEVNKIKANKNEANKNEANSNKVKDSNDNPENKIDAQNKSQEANKKQKADKAEKPDMPKDKVVSKENIAEESNEVKEAALGQKEAVSEIQEQIVAVVSQQLQMPIEDALLLLDQMGLQPEALLSQEGFSAFISGAVVNGDSNQLLLDDQKLSQVTQLFDSIQALNQTTEESSAEENYSVLNLMTKVQSDVKPVLDEANDDYLQDAQGMMETLQTTEEVSHIPQLKNDTSQKSSKQHVEGSLNTMMDGTQNTEQIGMTVPIHHFTSSVQVQTQTFDLSSADGMTQRTVTIKQQGTHFVLDQVDFKLLGQRKELSIQLSPKELGTMNIKIVENNGVLVAEIKVDNEKTRDFIHNEIATLKQNFEEQGLNVTNVKVDIRQDDARQQMEQQKQKSNKRIQEIISQQFGAEETEEEIAVVEGDSEVDYKI